MNDKMASILDDNVTKLFNHHSTYPYLHLAIILRFDRNRKDKIYFLSLYLNRECIYFYTCCFAILKG